MAAWYDFLKSIKSSFDASATLTGITVLVGRDQPIPQDSCIRILRGDGGGEMRLRARQVGSKKTLEIPIEVWATSHDVDPAVGYSALAVLEDKVYTALEAWADNPPDISSIQFYAHVTKGIVANEIETRPMYGTRITVSIEYM
jgi:hypothetical protein